jgi:lactoylglutathione lyase
MRIAHVALWTRDLARAAEFWCAYFGAESGEPYRSARRPGFESRFLRFTDGAALELMSAPWLLEHGDAGVERPGWAHVAISLGSEDAVRELAARLDTAGLLVAAPRWTGDGFYEALAHDPDGNLVEITA